MRYIIFREATNSNEDVYHFEMIHEVGISHDNGRSFAISLTESELLKLIVIASNELLIRKLANKEKKGDIK